MPISLAKSEEKKAPAKRRSAKTRKTSASSESSATPEPIRQEVYEAAYERPHLHIEPQYHQIMSPQQPMLLQPVLENPAEQDDAQSASDCPDSYFGYLSSSTTSLQSSVYDPVYAHDNLPYTVVQQEYQIPPTTANLDQAFYGVYGLGSSNSKMLAPSHVPPPLSHPMDSPQPSGLCLYIPPEEATFAHTYTPYASASTPVTPMLAQNYNFSNPSPPMYQGPIDWNSRPLVPFQDPHAHPRLHLQHHQQHVQQLHHQHQGSIHHRPRSYSDVPMYSQTVSLDQVCSAGV